MGTSRGFGFGTPILPEWSARWRRLPRDHAAELRQEFHRLLAADILDEAEARREKLEPLSESEWADFLANAPEDDEPLTESERRGFDEVREYLALHRR
jgi:hypothetical protein